MKLVLLYSSIYKKNNNNKLVNTLVHLAPSLCITERFFTFCTELVSGGKLKVAVQSGHMRRTGTDKYSLYVY